jgi:hypothetical protein
VTFLQAQGKDFVLRTFASRSLIVSERRIQMAAMLSLTPGDSGLLLGFRDPDGGMYRLEIPAGAIGGLIVALRSHAAVAQGGSGQPMTLDSGRPFTLLDGRVGLELLLEGTVRLPVLFPREAIPVLRRTLDELERLSTKSPRRPRAR